MADAQTKVIIGGDATGAVRAISDTQKALAAASGQMQNALAPLGTGLSKIQGAFAALGTVLAGGALFKASVGAANDWNAEVGKLAKSLGTTTENASVMAVALDHLGISADVVVNASMAISKQLKSNEADFLAAGIQTRNYATGELLPAGEIMAAVNTKLAAQKNGVQQNIDGIKFYGKAWADARAAMKLTSDELERAKKRTDELGLLVKPDDIALTRAYKEQQRDLAQVWKSMEIQLGTAVLPILVELGAFMANEGPQAAQTFATALSAIAFAGSATWLALKDMGNALGALAAQAAALLNGNMVAFRAIGEARDEEAKKNEAAYERLKDAFSKPLAEEHTVAKKRQRLQEELQTKLADLESLRSGAAKKATDDILKDDDARTKAQISNAEKLKSAWTAALTAVKNESAKATEDAQKLLEKASETRTTGADKAAEIRRGQLSAEDQLVLNRRDATNLADSATQAALLAQLAAQNGRTENAAKLADQALKDAERASKFADKLTDPEEQARAVERIAEAQATAIETQAKVKQQEAKSLDETAGKMKAQIAEFDAQIKDLQDRAANIAVQLQIDQATAAITSLQQQIAALQDKTVTITVNTVQTGSTTPAPNSFSSESNMVAQFARGGYTGPGGKWDPRGIVHAGEFVVRSEVLKQQGVLSLLDRLNRYGAAALPGFADGGLVGRLAIPSLRSPQPVTERMAATFNFPGLGSYRASLSADTFAQLQRDFQRAALQKGGRA